ncbi:MULTISPECIES: xanthine dehydrogenase accessory protein XdhC [unclassified Oceanobacter]|uniref:xanthine dehydrogenase accessory protein XdhC n=1 Tax=unclassified Oceanobacter TaxID=2620260 RepID=UPI002736B9FC|nr:MULTISPECIES: xanthine dehydrogenase accessory protein XdhC [unclassified Oceanobacter]MDP2505895.1 xanthine dehydrogenase accessory protein XdhC [Oceanobacter sp. 3_MG-2023]MDP2608373.1 xanthine dehydrogenase accessory protein XdhC [Oceanobacter sp. 1_MG-2023]MDP2611468.1 xanthine dehydrogenase accessory protein XdhC [Oceanobacter sp. 2_MG-2023]
MKHWSESLAECQRSGQPHVLVTVISTGGSTPRAAGSKMLVLADSSIDTIGGGQLEYQALQQARALLQETEQQQVIRQVLLGADAGQCCGGYATLLFESYPARAAELWVFGAGHVAKALMQIVQQLPLPTRWIDNRPELFPAADSLAPHIECVVADTPEALLVDAPAGSRILILTHDHALDYRLAETALRLGHCASIGVIGSATKANRFRYRLTHSGMTEQQLEIMQCPVGLEEVAGKLPMEVAVSIAGQLIQQYQTDLQTGQRPNTRATGVPLSTLKQLMRKDKQTQDVTVLTPLAPNEAPSK